MEGILNMVRSIKRGANVGTTTGVRDLTQRKARVADGLHL